MGYRDVIPDLSDHGTVTNRQSSGNHTGRDQQKWDETH